MQGSGRHAARPGLLSFAIAALLLLTAALGVSGACGPDEYSSGGACHSLTDCRFDEFESTPPTNTSDRACSPQPFSVRANLRDNILAFPVDEEHIDDATKTGFWEAKAEGALLFFHEIENSFGDPTTGSLKVEAGSNVVRLTPKLTGAQTTTTLVWLSDLNHSQRLSVRVEVELDGLHSFIVAVRTLAGDQLLASAAATPGSGTTVMALDACITQGVKLIFTGPPQGSDLLISVTIDTAVSSIPAFVSPPVPDGHLLAFAQEARGEEVVLDFSATTSCGAVEYELVDEGNTFIFPFETGVLCALDDKGVEPGEEGCLTVRVLSDNPVCFFADSYTHLPCSTSVSFCYVTVGDFENVTNFSVLKDSNDLLTFREPAEPTVPYLHLNSSGFRSPAVLGLGVHTSEYFLTVDLAATTHPGVVLHETLDPVNVTIHVFYGETVFVPELGHEFFPALNTSMDFLAESTSAHGVKGVLVPLEVELSGNEGVALRFEATKRGNFFYDPPAGSSSRLFIHTVYCKTSFFKQDYREEELTEPAETTIIVEGLDIVTIDLGSGYKDSHECFSMYATTEPISGEHEIEEIVVSFKPTSSKPTNFTVDNEPYRVMFFSEFVMLTENIAEDPGKLLHVEDNEPPVFTFCPPIVEAFLEPLSDRTRVNFTAPIATDNAGEPLVSGTHSPGDVFTLLDSPYLIHYTAVDDAGLIADCEFHLIVVHHQDHEVLDVEVSNFSVYQPLLLNTPFLQHSIYADAMLSAGRSNVSITFDPSDYLGLTIDLRPPPGERIGLAGPAVTTADNVPGSVVVTCNLQFRNPAATGPLPTETPPELFAFSSIETIDLKPFGSDVAVDTRPAFPHTDDATIFSLEPGNEYIRLRTESIAFAPQDFTMDHMAFTLEYPFGVNTSTGPIELVMLPESSVEFTYFYTDPLDHPFPNNERHHHLSIHDPNPPNVTSCPGSVEFFMTGNEAGIAVSWADPTFVDDRGIEVIEQNFDSGDFFPLTKTGAPHVVEVVAKDISRNAATCSFTISVVDRTPPVLDCPASQFEVPADANVTTVNTDDINLSDNSGNTSLHPFNAVQAIGPHNITLIAEDEEGNRADCHWLLTVVDVTPPVVECPALLVQHDIQNAFTLGGLVMAQDNSGSYTLAHVLANDPSTALNSLQLEVGQHRILSKAVDPSGNEGTCEWDLVFFDSRLSQSQGAGASGSASNRELGVGLGLGICALIAIIAGLVARERRKQLPHDFNELMEELQRLDKLRYEADGPVAPRELKRSHITMLATLGKGNFGEVKKALMNEGNGIPDYLVAVKMHHGEFEGRKEMLQEALVMAQFKHPHIVAIVGVVTVGNPLLIALEYCEGGELKEYLVNNDTDLAFKLSAAKDCASGLAYLSERGFVHRDIAARNCLISSDMRFKISDFGLSRDTSNTTYYQSRGGAMPVRWTAPEALEHRKFTPKSDCWSYGILLVELFTRAELPYGGWSNQKVWTQVCEGYRLHRPEGCPEMVYDRMLACWNKDWRERPEFTELEDFFFALLESDTVVIEALVGERDAKLAESKGQKQAPTYVDLLRGTPPDQSPLFASDPDQQHSESRSRVESVVIPNPYDVRKASPPAESPLVGGAPAAPAGAAAPLAAPAGAAAPLAAPAVAAAPVAAAQAQAVVAAAAPAAAAPVAVGSARSESVSKENRQWLRDRRMTKRMTLRKDQHSQKSLEGQQEWVNSINTHSSMNTRPGKDVAIQMLGQDGLYDEPSAFGGRLRGTLPLDNGAAAGPPPSSQVVLRRPTGPLYDQELI